MIFEKNPENINDMKNQSLYRRICKTERNGSYSRYSCISRNKKVYGTLLIFLFCFVSGIFVFSSCIENRTLTEETSSFRVEALNADFGSPDDLLPYPESAIEVRLRVSALSNRGGIKNDFNGPASLSVLPGRIVRTNPDSDRITLNNGVGETSVMIDRMYGPTHICVEDNLGSNPVYAMGCSERFHFSMPAIANVQITDNSAESPLEGAFIDIGSGDMIVTGVFPEGFFLTDLSAKPVDGMPGDFGSIFVFSFSYPDGISVADRLSSVTGTVQVFVGSTQLVFPSWTHDTENPGTRADLPEPIEITEDICNSATGGTTAGLCGHSTSNLHIESLESALVTVKRARTPTRWVDCDFNRDGQIANFDPACNQHITDPAMRLYCDEIECKAECNTDKNCSELSSYRQYGQWAVTLDEGRGSKINVVTRDGLPEFDPLDEDNMGILIDVTGNLRHSLPARPRWLVLARDGDDVVIHR